MGGGMSRDVGRKRGGGVVGDEQRGRLRKR